jgi:broad specificity phosphatase PhoE
MEFMPGFEGRPDRRTPERSLVRMKFMRHGEKEAEGADPNLTERGRDQASTAGSEYGPNPNVAVGRGSPRHRTQETVQRYMGVARPDVVRDDMTAEEVEAAIDAEMAAEGMIGRKTRADARLNFEMEGEYKDSATRSLKEKRYLRFLVDDSDQVVIATGDRVSTSLLRQAGNVAELVRNYGGGVAKGWRLACERKPEDYKKFGYELERYLGTHAGVVESFLVKMLHQKKGADVMHEFVDAYPNGFSELGGVDIDVELIDNEPKFTLHYELPAKEEGEEAEERTVEFEMADLDSIIEQREALERMAERAAA